MQRELIQMSSLLTKTKPRQLWDEKNIGSTDECVHLIFVGLASCTTLWKN